MIKLYSKLQSKDKKLDKKNLKTLDCKESIDKKILIYLQTRNNYYKLFFTIKVSKTSFEIKNLII